MRDNVPSFARKARVQVAERDDEAGVALRESVRLPVDGSGMRRLLWSHRDCGFETLDVRQALGDISNYRFNIR